MFILYKINSYYINYKIFNKKSNNKYWFYYSFFNKIITNHHLTNDLNDDFLIKSQTQVELEDNINSIIDDLIDDVFEKSIIKNKNNVQEVCQNNIQDLEKINNNIIDEKNIQNEIKVILDDLITNIIDENQDNDNYLNNINKDDYATNDTGIPLESFLCVGYYLYHNNE